MLAILLVQGSKIFSQDKNFYIFLCLSQSNMEGNAKFQPQDTTVNRFRVMEAVNCEALAREMGKWYTAVPPLCRCQTGLTPADYFGRKMVAGLPKNIRIGIINVAVGGCKIELFDKGNYQAMLLQFPNG